MNTNGNMTLAGSLRLAGQLIAGTRIDIGTKIKKLSTINTRLVVRYSALVDTRELPSYPIGL